MINVMLLFFAISSSSLGLQYSLASPVSTVSVNVVNPEALAEAKKMVKSLTILMTKAIGEMKKATTAVQTGDVLVSYAKALAKKTLEIDSLKKKYSGFDKAAQDASLTKEAKVLQQAVSELSDLYTAAKKKYKDDEGFIQSMKAIMAASEKKSNSAKTDDEKK